MRARSSTRGCRCPRYDQVLKASHVFNLLDARGAISVDGAGARTSHASATSRGAVCQAYVELVTRRRGA